ncbi:MAG: hypothetical protein Q9209_005452 [Squamulea sp. 1 TL-2023]
MPSSTTNSSINTAPAYFACKLQSLHRADSYFTSSPRPPSNREAEALYSQLLSYIHKLRARLPHASYNRFCHVLASFGKDSMHTFETTRYELSVVFELANEYELWEEMLEMVFPVWTKWQEDWEQKRLGRMQRGGKGLPVD